MVERNIVEIRADVSGLSASQEAMSSKIQALEADADNARSDTEEFRKENLSLRSQITDLSNRLASVESGHVSSDVTISGLPLSLTVTPLDMVHKVFGALGIPELDGDILEVRVLAGKLEVRLVSDGVRLRPTQCLGLSWWFLSRREYGISL